MFELSTNGETTFLDVDDEPVIRVENTGEATCRCVACGEAVSETPDGYADESGSVICDSYDPDDCSDSADVEFAPEVGEGPHRPQRVPLSWANSAAIHTAPDEDAITVSISVDDPRGGLCFTVRRIPEDAPANGGRLIMHTPYPGESGAHVELTTDHPGTYWIS